MADRRQTTVISLIPPQLSRSSANFYWVLFCKAIIYVCGNTSLYLVFSKGLQPCTKQCGESCRADRILQGVGTALMNDKTTKDGTSQSSVKTDSTQMFLSSQNERDSYTNGIKWILVLLRDQKNNKRKSSLRLLDKAAETNNCRGHIFKNTMWKSQLATVIC